MGKFESKASQTLLNREKVITKTRMSLKDFILFPYRALKNWQRRREIRKNIFTNKN